MDNESKYLPFEASIDPDSGRVWVSGGTEDDFFSAVRDETGVWSKGAPAAYETMERFEDVKDAAREAALIKEARMAFSS